MARFVLVHGAFGGAWCWEPVIGPLEAAGHTVEALDLPGGGDDRTPVEGVTLASCSERVCDVLAARPEPAIQKASRISTRPIMSWSHQSSNSSFVMNATMMSKTPLKSRKRPTSAASVENVS